MLLARQKVLNFSFKYLKSVYTLNVRDFYKTGFCHQPRKISSARKRSTEVESTFTEDSMSSEIPEPPERITNENFYGIESDHGVINVDEHSKSSRKSAQTVGKPTTLPEEKFRETRFGNIRLDSENKVVLHGQYDVYLEELDLDTASATDEYYRIPERFRRQLGLSKNKSNQKTAVSKIQHNQKFIGEASGSNLVKNKSFYNTVTLSTTNDDCRVNELHFPENVDRKNAHRRNSNPAILAQTEHVQDSLVDTGPKRNASYIDETYFPETIVQENSKHFDSQQSQGEHQNLSSIEHSYVDNAANTGPKSNFSYIDETYFPEAIMQENLKHIDAQQNESKHKNLRSADIFSESAARNNPANAHKSADFLNHKETIENVNTFFQHDKNRLDPNESNPVKNTSLFDEFYFNHEIEENYPSKVVSESTESLSTDVSKSSEQNFKINLNIVNAPNYFNKPASTRTESIHIEKKLDLDSYANKSPSMNSGFADARNSESQVNFDGTLTKEAFKLDSKPQKTGHKKHIQKSSSTAPENANSEVENKVKTAYDFVSSLREKKETETSNFQKGRRPELFTEKLDSKGFRVLKNQVPNLMYYTRDEILEMLSKNVLYSDDDVVVLNKPYSLVIHESKTTKDACLSQYLDELARTLDKRSDSPKLYTTHRLDKETTGCLLLARNEAAADRLKSLFAQRKIMKTYWIVTTKVPEPSEGLIDIPIAEGLIGDKSRMVLSPALAKDVPYQSHSKRGKRALTRFKVIAEVGNAALVEVWPETGIKHQIRVHFGFGLSCPILGDHKYSHLKKLAPQTLPSDMLQRLRVRQSKVRHIPMHIYARSVTIPQYSDDRNLFVQAPMPLHMSKNLQRMKFKKN